MDYKYIEQILERYWQCETTLHEERILQSFFCQKEVPQHLMVYAHLFRRQEDIRNQALGKEFDSRLMARLGLQGRGSASQPYSVRRITIFRRLRPLYQAAGLVALVITIGTAAQKSIGGSCKTVQPTQCSVRGQAAEDNDVKTLHVQHVAAMKAQESDTLDYTR